MLIIHKKGRLYSLPLDLMFNVQIKPELFEKIDSYCKENGLSRSQFLELAIKTLKNGGE